MSLIVMKGLGKSYRTGKFEVEALKSIDLTVGKGELVAIMGKSGSGKSTLMNIMGCLDVPSAGTYLLDGQDVSKLDGNEQADLRNQKIGFVFQGFNLLSRIDAAANVELPLIYRKTKKALRREMVEQALELVGLSDRSHHLPMELSGGQQQRVAIARALVNQPDLVLADEPTGNLDSRTSADIMKVFHDLNENRSITLILVTHDAEVAGQTDRTIHLVDGEIVGDAVGTAQAEIY